jgi:hypothetical protein
VGYSNSTYNGIIENSISLTADSAFFITDKYGVVFARGIVHCVYEIRVLACHPLMGTVHPDGSSTRKALMLLVACCGHLAANAVYPRAFQVSLQPSHRIFFRNMSLFGMFQEYAIWHVMCCYFHCNQNFIGGNKMKKVLSTLVAALVAVSFASIVFAEEVKTDVKSETTTTSPSGEVKVEKKEVKKTVKKHKKHKKAMKEMKKEESPAAAPSEAPAAPAAK